MLIEIIVLAIGLVVGFIFLGLYMKSLSEDLYQTQEQISEDTELRDAGFWVGIDGARVEQPFQETNDQEHGDTESA